MGKIQLGTPDGTAENVDMLAELFPQAVTEVEADDGSITRAIDFDALRELLGDVAEGTRERYQFTWPGKAEARAEAHRPIAKTMRPERSKSKDWDTTQNLYIEGDNLDALKILKETYAGKVKLIYIDPPYNTGHDFVYDDDFAKTRGEYALESGDYDVDGGRLVANTEGNGRFHSDWCSMMYPRLLLARELLSEDGAIFISIDDNEEANLHKMGVELFGSGNYVGKLYVQVNPRGRNLDRYIANTIEPILVFVKDYSRESSLHLIPKDERMLSEYSKEDPKGRYRPIGLRNRNQAFNPRTRPNLYFTLWIDPSDGSVSTESDERHNVSTLPVASDGTPTCWTWSKDKIERENDYVYGEQKGGEWRVYRKDYLDEGSASMTMAKSLQSDSEFNNDYGKRRIKELFGSNVMSFPKPPALMRRILEIGSAENSIIMDFFSGSATMADAVMQLNSESGSRRTFIMIQLPECVEEETTAGQLGIGTICELGEERIRRAGEKIRAEFEETNRQLKSGEKVRPVPDIGFRVLRIDSSNMKNMLTTPEETAQKSLFDSIDNVKEGRSDEDLLFEVLPKFRIPYSVKIEERTIAGRKCMVVESGLLVACFDNNVGIDTIEAIAKMEPIYAVIRDTSMTDDATHANFEELFRTHSPDTIRRVI